jgi:hypothetical protein
LIRIAVLTDPVEQVGGDGFAWKVTNDGNVLFTVVDGLGHGNKAVEAMEMFKRIFFASAILEPAAMLKLAHSQLRTTVGVVSMVVYIDRKRRLVRFAGTGNITMYHIFRNVIKMKRCDNGIVGYRQQRLRQTEFSWDEGDYLVLHTDGLHLCSTAQDVFYANDALHIAQDLHAQFKKGHDDALVLVCSLQSDGEVLIQEEFVNVND